MQHAIDPKRDSTKEKKAQEILVVIAEIRKETDSLVPFKVMLKDM